MHQTTPTLHILCGKAGAGKSTLAGKLSQGAPSILIAEDEWLAALYGEQMSTVQDFVRFSAKLRATLAPHIASLLDGGLSVILDFQANTVASRAWMRGLLDKTGARHQLHYLATPDAVCLQRIRARNAAGTHPFQLSDDDFHRVSRHFVPPSEDEGFTIIRHEL